jgi:hypothetical protein
MKRSIMDMMAKMQGCQRAGCTSGQRPVRIPVVTVWASPRKDHEPANFIYEHAKVCAPCAAEMKLADLLSAAGQEQLTAAFRKDGKSAPCWPTAMLQWRSIPARGARS